MKEIVILSLRRIRDSDARNKKRMTCTIKE